MFCMEFLDQAPELLRVVENKAMIQACYEKLCSLSPNQKTLEILQEIIKDEKRHSKTISSLYSRITGCNIPGQKTQEVNVLAFTEGLSKVAAEEVNNLDIYKGLYIALKRNEYRDVIMEIILDEIKHSMKLNMLQNTRD